MVKLNMIEGRTHESKVMSIAVSKNAGKMKIYL
jgi:hypothetical protein